MQELVFASAEELAPLLKERKVSPVELTRAFLERIEALDGNLRAYITVTAEEALVDARRAEAELASGAWRGPLHGVPMAYKDIIDVAGVPMTAGSRVLTGHIADQDATVVTRLKAAGAITLGKLNLLEFASGSMEVYGDARNPWNLEYSPGGGSSAGSGVATAAGLATCTLGTDTGGSIRGPAAGCGIVGLKPTYGRVSRAGVVPLSWSLDHVGPMTRSVADAAIMLACVAGADPRDVTAARQPVPDYAAALGRPVEGLRIGVPRRFFYEDCDAEVSAAMEETLRSMTKLGLMIREIELPNAWLGPAASWTIAYTEAFAYHRRQFLQRSGDYTESFLWKITAAGLLSAEERLTAQRVQQVVTQEFVSALTQVDAIVVPATRRTPAPTARRTAGPPRGEDMNSVTRPISLTGLPTISLPCGFSSTGLPLGFQLVGRSWDEETLFAIGHKWEQLQNWRSVTPISRPAEPSKPASFTVLNASASPGESPIDSVLASHAVALSQLSYVTPDHIPHLARMLQPVQSQLQSAREHLPMAVEPPVRPAP